MSFLPIEIEVCPGFGFTGGPEFSTNIQPIANGHENRNADWAVCRHKYTAPYKNINEQQYLNIKTVFLLTRGRTHSFLHKDAADYLASNDQFGIGDGTTRTFQLSKLSKVAGTSVTYVRKVTRPLTGAKVYADGVLTGATISLVDGTITFAVAPAIGVVLTWDGEFRVPVRFDMDYLPFSIDDKNKDGLIQNGSIDLIEVLDEEQDAA